VDSAGDLYTWAGWPIKRGHGQKTTLFAVRPVEDVFGASGSSAFYRAEALRRAGGFDPLLGSYYEDVDLAFRLRWAGYRCVFSPGSVIHHDVSATYNHKSPVLQRRMARNAEIVFWANLPPGLLAKALLPHLAFLGLQALWRLARGGLSPFLLGKCDAIRAWPGIQARRRHRAGLVARAGRRPHFELNAGFVQAVANHLRRPRERSGQTSRARTS
jgi:GT2 family glycosyltransferase